MADFVWVVPRDKAILLGEVGVSNTYIIPNSAFTGKSTDLIDSFLWVVLRGDSDRLVLVIKVLNIDRIIDGYYNNDFIVRPDPKYSFKIGSTFMSLASFEVKKQPVAIGAIGEITTEDAGKIIGIIFNNINVRLSPPVKRMFTDFIVEMPSKNKSVLARMVGQIAVSSFNFIDIWGDGKSKKYKSAPFASMSKAYIEMYYPQIDLKEIENLILDSDPFLSILSRDVKSINSLTHASMPSHSPDVDIFFRLIDPENIFSREFTASSKLSSSIFDQIKKTEAAEKMHQDILRDVSRFLIGQGVQPFQSDSVDLAYMFGGELHIFEIKTSNVMNAISQASKGAFQLACYKNGLDPDYESITASLLIEDTGSEDLNKFLFETVLALGIKTYFYRPKLNWPSRVLGLPLVKNSTCLVLGP